MLNRNQFLQQIYRKKITEKKSGQTGGSPVSGSSKKMEQVPWLYPEQQIIRSMVGMVDFTRVAFFEAGTMEAG